jgi:RND family efflux transporter MFP subunit
MRTKTMLVVMGLGALPGCREQPAPEHLGATAALPAGRVIEVRDTTIPAVLEAAGIAEPVRRATLSTKLMGAVTAVLVHEGEPVKRGQLLARIDASDIAAKRAQAGAGIAEADAMRRDALTQAQRYRALYADSAATRAQLDAVETALARAEAGARTAQAAASEVEALGAYAQVRAPFAGVVTRRFVDPGAFVAPGTPVAAVQDASRLRISVTAAPGTASALKPGMRVHGTIERQPVEAVVEGVAPAGGALYRVNAIVDNAGSRHPAGGAATLRIPQGTRTGLLVPRAALVREGDLTGVRVRAATGLELRWVRLGSGTDETVEVLSGLRSGDPVFVPEPAEGGD